jgi:hypothetical protein
MDKLIALKMVIARVYVDINKDGRKEIIVPMGSMFHKPLVMFELAYKNFIETVAKAPDTYDRWLNIQLQVLTELQDDQDAIKQFAEAYAMILKSTPGGEAAEFKVESHLNTSYVIALAFRVYLDAIVITDVVMPKDAVAPAPAGAA